MKGRLYFSRTRRLLTLMLVLTVVYFFVSYRTTGVLTGRVEDKVNEFLGHNLHVRIGGIEGGVFQDMVLRDVELIPSGGDESRAFSLERMEISYRFWRAVGERFGLVPGEIGGLDRVSMYFSDRNPFVRGNLKFYSHEGAIDITGRVSAVIFGDVAMHDLKGVLRKRGDGLYDCDMIWDGRIRVQGTLDPVGRKIELRFDPIVGRKGTISLNGSIDDSGDIEVYSRFDKVDLFGTEVIGDLEVSYKDGEPSLFMVRADNLVVDKRPFWGFVIAGGFSPGDRTVFLDNVRWGEGMTLTGKIRLEDPYDSDLRIVIDKVDISDIADMFTSGGMAFSGRAEGEITVKGPIEECQIRGRLHVGEGAMGNMSFKSISAGLKGRFPVISVEGSRVVKDGGHILVSGEMDFGRIAENKVFEGVVFDTDNKVAVWEDWQISKEDSQHMVQARKDNVILSTALEDSSLQNEPMTRSTVQKDVGIEYKIDQSNSIKAEFEEEKDFLGVQHKIQF